MASAKRVCYGETFAALARLELGRPQAEDIDRLEGQWDLCDRLQAAFSAAGLPVFDPQRPASDLSCGERMRAALCGAMLGGADFLLLDEPTNYLVLASSLAIEAALASFPGAMLVVSHDEAFLQELKLTHRLQWRQEGWQLQNL